MANNRKEVHILLQLLLMAWMPHEVLLTLCNEYRTLVNPNVQIVEINTDQTRPCYELSVFPANGSNAMRTKVLQIMNKSAGSDSRDHKRCESYVVELIEFVIVGYTTADKSDLQVIGRFDSDTTSFTPLDVGNQCNTDSFIIVSPSPASTLDCPVRANTLYRRKTPNFLKVLQPSAGFTVEDGISVEWHYILSNNDYPNTTPPLNIDIISRIMYNNKERKDNTRTKVLGLMNLKFNFEKTTVPLTPKCASQLIDREQTKFASTAYTPELNLCRCLNFKEGPDATFHPDLTSNEKMQISNCFDFSFSNARNTYCLVVARRTTNNCRSLIGSVEDIIFSTVTDKQYPFGLFKTINQKTVCPGLDALFPGTSIDLQKSQRLSCFSNLSKKNYERLFHQRAAPQILRLQNREGANSRYFGAKFMTDTTFLEWPKRVQFQAHIVVNGNLNANSFRQLIVKHIDTDTTSSSGQLTETTTKPEITLNEDYHDDIYFVNKNDSAIPSSICSTLNPKEDHLCKCFARLRTPPVVVDIFKLIQENSAKWKECFKISTEFRNNDINSVNHEFVVEFINQCPVKFEVKEVVIEALSFNGLPFGGDWSDVILARNHPSVWAKEACLRAGEIKGRKLVLRETWGVFQHHCVDLDADLTSTHLQKNPISFFHSNRPLVGSNKGQASTANNSYGVCGVWRWRRDNKFYSEPYFEMQFLAQAVILDLSDSKEVIAVVRSDKYSAHLPSVSTALTKYEIRKLADSSAAVDIDLNSEYYDKILAGDDNTCLNTPDSFDDLDDEICTCFFDSPDRGKPNVLDTDITLELQSRTQINVQKVANKPFQMLVSVEIEPEMDKIHGIYEFVLQIMAKHEGDVTKGLPVGTWENHLDINGKPGCSQRRDEAITIHNCSFAQESTKLLPNFTIHSIENPPTVFHFQNPWKDTYFMICVVWGFPFLPQNTSFKKAEKIKGVEFQVYAQFRYLDRSDDAKFYSSADHGFQIFKFDEAGDAEIIDKPASTHDDDFRVRLHPNIKREEQQAQCFSNPKHLPVPKFPIFDSFTCLRFHPDHSVTQRIDMDDDTDSNQNDAVGCFTLDAYPLLIPQYLHVRYRQHDLTPGSQCSNLVASEIFIMAIDQNGDPIGTSFDSFDIYDNVVHESDDAHVTCADEDLIRNRTETFYGDENGIKDHHVCTPYTKIQHTQTNVFIKPENIVYSPTVHHATFLNYELAKGGICFTWSLKPDEYPQTKRLQEIQFIAEVFVPSGWSNTLKWSHKPRNHGNVYIVRSEKYKYNLNENYPLNGPKPKCHDESLLGVNEILEKIPRPSGDQSSYNLQINGDQFRACKKTYRVSCEVDTHYPTPQVVTNPPINLNGTTAPPLIGPTRAPFDVRPEKAFYGCLTIKKCITPETVGVKDYEPNCIETLNCKHLIAIGKEYGESNLDDSEVVIELYAQSKGWIAIGLSTDNKMGGDYVVECVKNPAPFGKPHLYNSWNVEKNNLRLRGDQRVSEIRGNSTVWLKESIQTHASIYCKFVIKKQFVIVDPEKKKSHKFDLTNDKICILMAWSNAVKGHNEDGNIGGHSKGAHGNKFPCEEFIPLGRRFVPTETQVTYFKFHGVLMTFAWVFCISIGNFIGRYYKAIYDRTSYFGMKLWNLLHIGFSLVAIIPMAIGTYFNLAGSAGWESILGPNTFHRYAGSVTMIVYLVNIFIGWCLRPRAYDEFNKLMVVHVILGHVPQVLSCVIIAETPKIAFSSVSCITGYMGIGWMFVYLVCSVTMSYHKFWIHYFEDVETERPSNVETLAALTKSRARQTWEGEGEEPEAPGRIGVRTIVLILFATLAFLFFLTISGLIIWPPIGPCFKGEDFDDFDEFPPYDAESLESDDL